MGLVAGAAILLPFAAAQGRPGLIGTIAALTLIAVYVGLALPGYVLGLAGIGRAGWWLTAGALIALPAISVFALSGNMPSNGDCSDCLVAAVVPILLSLLIPLWIGYRRGRRARSRPVAP